MVGNLTKHSRPEFYCFKKVMHNKFQAVPWWKEDTCLKYLLGKKEVSIPVSAIDRIEEDTVYLKLDKKAVESLPSEPVRRSW